jgi:hypothetical protein
MDADERAAATRSWLVRAPGRAVTRGVTAVRRNPWRALAALAALVAAVAVFLVATRVFPYRSVNHDEAVYLQQAAMLLEGQLFLFPPVEDALRPWFFVADGGRLYPKYAPVTAAIFAAGRLLGSYHVALVAVGAALVALTYATTAEAVDRRTGALAAWLMAATPQFLVETSVFLSYAPTGALNLAFAWAYLRADRTGSRRWAAAAGAATGLAFFARPFTAVTFAGPFVAHACWRLLQVVRDGRPDGDRAARLRERVALLAPTAALGVLGVGTALSYNSVVTGDPLVFPYEAFAPLDGLGFGRRELLGYSRTFTPELAARASVHALVALFGAWVVAGPLGSALAALGAASAVSEADARLAAFAGVVPAVALGNTYFWGTLNALGSLETRGDGLADFLGPFYHFDALAPVAALAAVGLFAVVTRVRARWPDGRRARLAATAAVVVLAAAGTATAGATVAAPLQANAAVTDQYEQAYAPVDREFEDALVFLPAPYGPWLNHPFQALRNDPGFDGEAVYALRERQFAVVDAFPDRRHYRYVYRGQWAPFVGEAVESRLQRVRHVRGERVTLAATLGVPAGAESVTFRLGTDASRSYYVLNGTPASATVRVVVADGRVRLRGPVAPAGNATAAVDGREDVELLAVIDYGGGQGFDYRLSMPVRAGGESRALTPAIEVCRDRRRCGGQAAYVPRATAEGVSVAISLSADDGNRARNRTTA